MFLVVIALAIYLGSQPIQLQQIKMELVNFIDSIKIKLPDIYPVMKDKQPQPTQEELIKALHIDTINFTHPDLYPIWEGDKYSYIDSKGKIVIKP